MLISNKIFHVVIRLIVLAALLLLSIIIGLNSLDPNRFCGTGDAFAMIPWIFGSYLLWSLGLLWELFYIKRKRGFKKNSNIILISLFPFLLLILWVYFEIVN